MTATNPDFTYWNSVDPASFLDHDWQNPSRQWACNAAIEAANGGTLLEVGPGPGVDYERYFREYQKAGLLQYAAYEGSQNLCTDLRKRFPEAQWHCQTIADLKLLSFDVVYARHVMEHQPALQPALGLVLGAARHTVVLSWYRAPGPTAFHEVWEGVHCQTYQRQAVLRAVAQAGFRITEEQKFETAHNPGDEAWVLERQA